MALVCVGCTKQAAQESSEAAQEEVMEVAEEEAEAALDITGEWKIVRLQEMPIITPDGVDAPKLSFEEGNCHLSFCNEINASYTLNDNEITFGEVASTKKMGMPEVMAMEQALVALISGTVMVTVDGNTMTLSAMDGAPLMMLTK